MNQIDLSNRVAVVTGGARGIGYAVAQRFLQSGADVALWDVDAERLASSQAALQQEFAGRRVEALALDLTDTAAVDAGMAGVASRLGRLDILVNNAGITGGNGPTWELDPDVWRRVVEVNLIAPYLTCRAAVPHMLKGAWGRIVNVASILGLRVAGHVSAYAASKAGLLHLTKALALEWARHGIRVNALCPGYIETELNRDFFATEPGQALIRRVPQRRLGQPADLDGPLLLLLSDLGRFMTGSEIVADGGHLVSSL